MEHVEDRIKGQEGKQNKETTQSQDMKKTFKIANERRTQEIWDTGEKNNIGI